VIKCANNILLQPLEVTYAKQVFDLFNNPAVAVGYDSPPIEVGETPMVFTYRIIKGSNVIWKISLPGNADTLVGVCALHKYSASSKTIEIGGTLLPNYWNQNIMGSTLVAVINYAIDNFNLKKIIAKTSPTNIQAIRLVSKLGFVKNKQTVNETELVLHTDEKRIIKTSIFHLKKGEVILCPTDTIWGLSCNALLTQAIEKIDQIKNRPASKSYIVLMKDFESVGKYASINVEPIKALLEKTQKPSTIIYTLKNNLLQHLAHNDNTLAIRIPQKGFIAKLLQQIDFPIVSTSANLSGDAAPVNFSNINTKVRNGVDYLVPPILDHGAKPKASTIIKLLDDGKYVILRD